MWTPNLRFGVSAPSSAALILSLASAGRWVRPLGECDLDHGMVDMIRRVSSLPCDHWAQMVTPSWRPLVDALALAVAGVAGVWTRPRTGLAALEMILTHDREYGCAEDAAKILRLASQYAEESRAHAPCPACEIVGDDDCARCMGTAIITLRHDRWSSVRLLEVAR